MGPFYQSFKHTTALPGSTFDLGASLGTDQHLFVAVAAVLLANSISSFLTSPTQDNKTNPTIILKEILDSDVSSKHVYFLAELVVISFFS